MSDTTINERMKYVREVICGLSQAKFAEKIGYKQTSLCSIENGTKVTERAIRMLVTAYPEINENWLRTGEGSPLLEDADSIERRLTVGVQKLIYSNDTFTKEFVAAFLELPQKKREAVAEFFANCLK